MSSFYVEPVIPTSLWLTLSQHIEIAVLIISKKSKNDSCIICVHPLGTASNAPADFILSMYVTNMKFYGSIFILVYFTARFSQT
jgi:hypothetical protein